MRILLVFILSFWLFTLHAQLVNQGGTITVKSGATLVVESDLINTTGSIILESNATLNVTGDFTNQATMSFDPASHVIFSGTSGATVTSGGGSFGNLRVDKSATADLILGDAMIINGELDFAGSNNKVVLGNHNLTFGSNASVDGVGGSNYVVVTGTGRFIKPIAANSTLTFEVGDNVPSTNYSPLSVAVTGSGYSSATVGVNLVNAVHPNKPGTSADYLTRYWNVLASGISDYSANLTGTFVPGDDVEGTQSEIDGASWDGADWDFTNSTHSGNTVSATATNTDIGFTGFNKNVTLNLTAYIEGYMNGGVMRPVLLNSGEPGATASQADHIKVSLHNASAPYAKAYEFDGILGVNGTLTCTYPGAVSGNSYYVVLTHRNALETWSASPVLFGSSNNYSFASGAAQAYGGNMVQVGGVWCLYSGDINQDEEVNPGDFTLWVISNANGDIGYYDTDLDGDGEVTPGDYTIWVINNGLGVFVFKP